MLWLAFQSVCFQHPSVRDRSFLSLPVYQDSFGILQALVFIKGLHCDLINPGVHTPSICHFPIHGSQSLLLSNPDPMGLNEIGGPAQGYRLRGRLVVT